MSKTIELIITRQPDPESEPYDEEFEIPYRENMNVISALMEIQRNPYNKRGEKVTPVVWEANCLEEVCGACSMVINDTPQQACSALIDQLEQPVRIAPMATFPVQRDLIIERERMFDALKRVKAWIPIDGSYDLGPGPRMAETERQWAYELSKCMTCGVCLEACPNVNSDSDFMGPFLMPQVELKNLHPTGEMNKDERTEALIGKGGVQECGNSQNCTASCPKGIPITTSIAVMNKEATKMSLRKWLNN